MDYKNKKIEHAVNSFKNSSINSVKGIDRIISTGKVFKDSPMKIYSSANAIIGYQNKLGGIYKAAAGTKLLESSIANSISKINMISSQLQKLVPKVPVELKGINSYYDTILKIKNIIKEAHDNPDSFINYLAYINKLDIYFWSYPYKMSTELLKEYLEESSTDEEFDKKIVEYLDGDKTEDMFSDILLSLDENKREAFEQVVVAYNNGLYILVSLTCTSIMDGLLSSLYGNSGNNVKPGIIDAIIDYDIDFSLLSDFNMLQLMMFSSNVNTLFESITFNQEIVIETSKKTRRHPMMHGRMFSNSKAGALMVINTLYYYIDNKEFFNCFKGSIDKDKQTKKWGVDSNMRGEIMEKMEKLCEK